MLLRQMPSRSEPGANSPDPAVRLIEPSPGPATTAVERLTMIALCHENPISLSSLVETRALYYEELANGLGLGTRFIRD